MTEVAIVAAPLRGRRSARSEIIDRVAMAMAHRKGRTWSRMTCARRDQMRTLARAGLWALISDYSDACSFVAVDAAEAVSDGTDAFALSRHVDAYIRQVLS